VELLAPDGKSTVKLESKEAGSYVKEGYRLITPELQASLEQKHAEEEKYGGTLNALKEFGLGALNGPSLGMASPFLEGMGVSRETLQKLPEYPPEATTGGEVVGMVGA